MKSTPTLWGIHEISPKDKLMKPISNRLWPCENKESNYHGPWAGQTLNSSLLRCSGLDVLVDEHQCIRHVVVPEVDSAAADPAANLSLHLPGSTFSWITLQRVGVSIQDRSELPYL